MWENQKRSQGHTKISEPNLTPLEYAEELGSGGGCDHVTTSLFQYAADPIRSGGMDAETLLKEKIGQPKSDTVEYGQQYRRNMLIDSTCGYKPTDQCECGYYEPILQ